MTFSSTCRLTGEPLEEVLDLGRQPLGNAFVADENADEYFFPLRCGFAPGSKLFQLFEQPSPAKMFHDDYAFVSGTSRAMETHFQVFAEDVLTRDFLSSGGLVVEIGCNDGILLSHFAKKGFRHLGVEPAGSVAQLAEARGLNVSRQFFDPETVDQIIGNQGPADVILAANVICHIPDIQMLADSVRRLLKPTGLFIFEEPYLGDVVRLGSYDQVYDEHVFLFSALSVKQIFESYGMELIDVEHQKTHGGSMRYTLAKSNQYKPSSRVDSVLGAEKSQGLDSTSTFLKLAERVVHSAIRLKEFLEGFVAKNLKVAAFGATSKSTTIYNFARIGPDLVTEIYDNSPGKVGKLSPGMHIPVVHQDKFSTQPPDATFLAAWNHHEEIFSNNPEYSRR